MAPPLPHRLPGRVTEAFQALVGWVRERGGYVGPLRAVGRRLEAATTLDARQEVLRVPISACLTERVARATAIGARLPAEWTGPAVLAAASIELRREREWAPFFATLPTWVGGHPNHLPAAWLAGTTVGDTLPEVQAIHRAEWEWLRDELPLSEEEWRDARTVVTSRQFDVGEGTALVPIADLFDHALDPELDWVVEDRALVMRTSRVVPAGTTLHDTYGRKSNARLMLHYGFALPDNPDDETVVDFGAAGLVTLSHAVDNPGVALAREVIGAQGVMDVLVARREGLPIGASGVVRHLVDGERAVLDTWIQRLACRS